jgi:hypothetical protein
MTPLGATAGYRPAARRSSSERMMCPEAGKFGSGIRQGYRDMREYLPLS